MENEKRIVERWIVIDGKWRHLVFTQDRTYVDGLDSKYKSMYGGEMGPDPDDSDPAEGG